MLIWLCKNIDLETIRKVLGKKVRKYAQTSTVDKVKTKKVKTTFRKKKSVHKQRR